MAAPADGLVVPQEPGNQIAKNTTNRANMEQPADGQRFLNGLFCLFCVLTGQFFVDSTTLPEPNDGSGERAEKKGGYM